MASVSACGHGQALRQEVQEAPVAAPEPIEEVIGRESPDDDGDGADGIPQGCLWNMEGTYAIADAFSPVVAALRYKVQDDGRFLTIRAIQAGPRRACEPASRGVDAACGGPGERPEDAGSQDALRFRRSAEGFLEVVESGGDAAPQPATSAWPGPDIGSGGLSSITDCGRTHLTIQTAVVSAGGNAQKTKASGRTSPDLDPSESDGSGNDARRPVPEAVYRTIRLTRAR